MCGRDWSSDVCSSDLANIAQMVDLRALSYLGIFDLDEVADAHILGQLGTDRKSVV